MFAENTLSWLTNFPYVDGHLYNNSHELLKFTAKSRKLIIDSGEKPEWNQINSDILASILLADASEDGCSHFRMHYISILNIMKIIKKYV